MESRGATAYDFGGTIARYLGQTSADRGKLVGLTRYVQRDPRAWTGTVYVASEPGGHPREEKFPAGTVPTWARLLSGGGEAGGPDARVAALGPGAEMRAQTAGEAGAPGADAWTMVDPSWRPGPGTPLTPEEINAAHIDAFLHLGTPRWFRRSFDDGTGRLFPGFYVNELYPSHGARIAVNEDAWICRSSRPPTVPGAVA